MKLTAWWMRIVGAFYLLLFVLCAIVRIPIAVEGPEGTLEKADMGDPLASFVVDSWVTYGIMLGVIGTALLIASRMPVQARVLIITVIGLEMGGIIVDLYKWSRGYPWNEEVIWIVIHSVIIVAGLLALRKSRAVSGAIG